MTHGFMSILKEDVRVITKDGFEIGLFLFRLFIVRKFRFLVLLKFLFLSGNDFFNQAHTHLQVKLVSKSSEGFSAALGFLCLRALCLSLAFSFWIPVRYWSRILLLRVFQPL